MVPRRKRVDRWPPMGRPSLCKSATSPGPGPGPLGYGVALLGRGFSINQCTIHWRARSWLSAANQGSRIP